MEATSNSMQLIITLQGVALCDEEEYFNNETFVHSKTYHRRL